MQGVIRRTAVLTGALLGVVWLLVLLLGFAVPMQVLRAPVESVASELLGRTVSIRGEVALKPSLGPTVVLHDLHIAYPGEQGATLLRASRVEARLGFFRLLMGDSRVVGLLVEDLDIYPGSGKDTGWQFPQLDLPQLVVRNFVLQYRDASSGQGASLRLAEVTGKIARNQPVALEISGILDRRPFVASLTGGSLSDLYAPGAQWPFQVDTRIADSVLSVNGALVLPAEGEPQALQLELQGELASGQDDRSSPEKSVLNAELAVDFQGPRPRLSGALQVPTLSLKHLTDRRAQGNTGRTLPRTSPVSVAEHQAGIAGWLSAVDADLVLSVSELADAPVGIRDANVRLFIRDGELTAPMDITIAGVPFQGRLLPGADGDEAVFALTLAAKDISAASLARNLGGPADIRGEIGHVEIHATLNDRSGQGHPAAFTTRLVVAGARLTYGNAAGGQPVDFGLDEMTVTLQDADELSLQAQGNLHHEPFSVEVSRGRPGMTSEQRSWPVKLSASGAGARIMATGMLADAAGYTGTRLNLEMSGDRLGDLAPWIGISPCAGASYTARGQLVLSEDIARLQFLKAQTGDTRLNGDLDWSRDEQIPLLHAVVHFEALDPADLYAFRPLAEGRGSFGAARGISIHMPVLPRPVVLTNADIRLTMDNIMLKPVAVTEVALSSQIRAGRVERSPFQIRIGDVAFHGYLDPAEKGTGMVFEFGEADKVSGSMLDKLFSSAVRWAGSAATVPLKWIFWQSLSGEEALDCEEASEGGIPQE